MRCMVRNKIELYYALYSEMNEIVDEYGNATGQFTVVYGNPKRCFANISAARGEMQTRQFGEGEGYDRVVVIDDPNTEINEYANLWIDTKPVLSEDGSLAKNDDGSVKSPHDYIVKKVARSLNSVSIAVSKVVVR